MKHDEIWSAIDALAADRAVSVSRLARMAGLDPTTFNRSKRVSADGRLRWPSTESISKVLAATNATLGEMMRLGGVSIDEVTAIDGAAAGDGTLPPRGASLDTDGGSGAQGGSRGGTRVPLIGIAHAGNSTDLSSAGEIVGAHWAETSLPLAGTGRAIAFRVEGASMGPFYRDGDTLVTEVDGDIRPGHRVVVRTGEGDVLVKELVSLGDEVVLAAFSPDEANVTYAAGDITWMARIIWVSQ